MTSPRHFFILAPLPTSHTPVIHCPLPHPTMQCFVPSLLLTTKCHRLLPFFCKFSVSSTSFQRSTGYHEQALCTQLSALAIVRSASSDLFATIKGGASVGNRNGGFLDDRAGGAPCVSLTSRVASSSCDHGQPSVMFLDDQLMPTRLSTTANNTRGGAASVLWSIERLPSNALLCHMSDSSCDFFNCPQRASTFVFFQI